MFEHKSQKLASKRTFIGRVLKSVLYASGVMGFSLLVGVVGYHILAPLPWVDSLLNASMILGGMGPVDTLKSDGAKIFASIYALYSGLVLIGMIGLLLAPVFHRILHSFHEKP